MTAASRRTSPPVASAPSAHRPPALRVVPGELVATRLELMPVRRSWIPIPVRPVSWARVALQAAGVLGALAVVAGAEWLVVAAVLLLIADVAVLVALVVAWVQAHLLLIVAAVGLLLFLFLRFGRSSCAGLHCGGCRG